MSPKFLWLCLFYLLGNSGFAQNETYIFPRIKSTISLPVSIPVAEVNRLINQSVSGVIYQDDSYTNNNNDQFKVKVEKSGQIKLSALKGNRFLIEVPLKIWAEQGYGGLGVYMYQDTQFNVVMKFITSVSFQKDWTLLTLTKANGFKWTTKPVLDYGKVKIPIASMIEETLTEEQSKFTTLIDRNIKESFDLKTYLIPVWNQFNEPIMVSEDYQTWLKITPQKVYMTPLVIYSDYIKATLGLDLYSETYIGAKPVSSKPITSFPDFQIVAQIPSDFNIKTTANITYEEATSLARKQFLNQEFELTSENSKVKITDIKVYGENLNVVIEAQTEGAINGTVFIKGFPVYDAQKQKIVLTNTDFKLKTRNILKKAIALVFEGKIKRMIENEYGIPMKDIIDSSKSSLTESFNKEYFPGIFLKGNVINLQPVQVLVFHQSITAVIETNANLQMSVSGLSF